MSPMGADAEARRALARRMAAIPTRDTKPERRLRSLLHSRGLRFRLHQRVVPGSPRREVDIVFRRERVAVQVLGCFWHGCPTHTRLGRPDRSVRWAKKLATNQARDQDTRERLAGDGWVVIDVWECDELDDAADRVERAVTERRQPSESRRPPMTP